MMFILKYKMHYNKYNAIDNKACIPIKIIVYKLYKNTKKPYNRAKIYAVKGSSNWWLRSTINDNSAYFSGINVDADWKFLPVSERMNVSPGFAI